MIKYWNYYNATLIKALMEHLYLVGMSMGFSIIVAAIIVYFTYRKKILLNGISYFTSVLYSVPSFALFSLLIPVTGLGKATAVIVLSLYSQYILIRNFSIGLSEINPNIIEAATGMGMTDFQILTKIRLPLGRKSILAGIKIAATSTIGIATIAATINAGGIGKILFDGLRTMSIVKILWGIILTGGLCISVNVLLWLIERIIRRAE